jgi:hypothetical protein
VAICPEEDEHSFFVNSNDEAMLLSGLQIVQNSDALSKLLQPLPTHEWLAERHDTSLAQSIYILTWIKDAANSGNEIAEKLILWSRGTFAFHLNVWYEWAAAGAVPDAFACEDQTDQAILLAEFLETRDDYIAALEEVSIGQSSS